MRQILNKQSDSKVKTACSLSDLLESMSIPASKHWQLDSLRQCASFKRALIEVLQDLSEGLSSLMSTRIELREGQVINEQTQRSGTKLTFQVISDNLEVWLPQELVALTQQNQIGALEPETINLLLPDLRLKHPFFTNSSFRCIDSARGPGEAHAPMVQISIIARTGDDCFQLWCRLSVTGVRRLVAYGKSSLINVANVKSQISLNLRAELRIPIRSLACVQKLLPGARFRVFDEVTSSRARGVLCFGRSQNSFFSIRECVNEMNWLCRIEEEEDARG